MVELINILLWICIFLIVFSAAGLDLWRNPMGFTWRYKIVRFTNWMLMGFSYALLFFGRYNLAAINTNETLRKLQLSSPQYGWIVAGGLFAYAGSTIFNGLIVDRMGGRKGIIVGCIGSGVTNFVLYIVLEFFPSIRGPNYLPVFIILVAINNYFQSFGSLAIVKIGAHWYHIRERGFFSGIFGVVVGFGFFLALDINQQIMVETNFKFCFLIPSLCLVFFAFLNYFLIHSRPTDAGFDAVEELDVDTGLAVDHKAQEAEIPKFLFLAKKVFSKRIFVVLALAELFLGWVRDGILTWYTHWMEDVFHQDPDHSTALALCAAGITLGAMFGSLSSGIISDLFFGSRRPPVAFLGMSGLTLILAGFYFVKNVTGAAILVGSSSLFFSAVHGITVSTCAMDFAGTGATATAVGLLDGTQKMGSGLQGIFLPLIFKAFGYRWWIIAMFIASVLCVGLLAIIISKKPPMKDTIGPSDEEEVLINADKYSVTEALLPKKNLY